MVPSLPWRDAKYIAPPLAASGVAGTASEVSPFEVQTAAVRALEGDIVALLQSVTHPGLTGFFVGMYLLAYPVLLGLTYIGLKREGRGRHADYAFAYTLIVVASTPFFYFVPVGVTGYTLPNVEPLLYEGNGAVQLFMTNVDTLQKALPSLHAGLAGIASLYAPEGYEAASWATTGLILVATLYLGIHWFTDLAVGLGLAYGCYAITPVVKTRLVEWREPQQHGIAGD